MLAGPQASVLSRREGLAGPQASVPSRREGLAGPQALVQPGGRGAAIPQALVRRRRRVPAGPKGPVSAGRMGPSGLQAVVRAGGRGLPGLNGSGWPARRRPAEGSAAIADTIPGCVVSVICRRRGNESVCGQHSLRSWPCLPDWETAPGCRRLRFFAGPVIIRSCRFTNIIARSASATAKSSSVPAIGRARNARIAARRSCPRNFPRSPRPPPAPPPPHRPATAAAAGIVAAAAATAIELHCRRDELYESCSNSFPGTRAIRPSDFSRNDTAWTAQTCSPNAGFRAPRRPPARPPRCRTGFSPADF